MPTRIPQAEIDRLLARKAREGLTYAELSRQTGISRHTISGWVFQARRKKAKGRARESFVELVVPDQPADQEAPIELVVDDRVALRIRRGFCDETLSRVLSVVQRSC